MSFALILRMVSCQGAIAEAGGVKALVDLIFKWSSSGDSVLVQIFPFYIDSSGKQFLFNHLFLNR